MAGSEKLVVVVVGDTRQFEQSLTRAEQKAGQFASGLGKRAGGARAELLAMAKSAGDSARESQKWMAERNRQLAASEQASASAGSASSALALRFGLVTAAAYVGVQALGQLSKALQVTGEKAGTVEGRARNLGAALLKGDIVGGLEAISRDGSAAADQLERIGDTAKLTELATQAAAIGMNELAQNAREAAAAVLAANSAFSDPTKIRDSTSPGAIAAQTSSLPLPELQRRARRQGITQAQRNQWFDAGITRMLDQVQDVRTLQGQIAALDKIAALIKRRIEVTKDITRKLNLEDQLRFVGRQRQGIIDEIAADAKARTDSAKRAADAAAAERKRLAQELAAMLAARQQARQSLALGDFTPSVANLTKQLASLTARISGSGLKLSSKLQQNLAGARKVLAGEFGKATEESRRNIASLFETIRGEFDKGAKSTGPLTKTTSLNADRILSGLGIGRDAEKELRARLSHFNSAGVALAGGDTSVTVQIDGRQIEPVMTKRQQQRTRRNPPKRRGR